MTSLHAWQCNLIICSVSQRSTFPSNLIRFYTDFVHTNLILQNLSRTDPDRTARIFHVAYIKRSLGSRRGGSNEYQQSMF